MPRLNGHWYTDAGQVATPGYKLPHSVVGLELRAEANEMDGRPPVELAFYSRRGARGTPLVLLVLPRGRVDCLVDPQTDALPYVYQCKPWESAGTGARECLPSDIVADGGKPAEVGAVLFSLDVTYRYMTVT